MIYRLKTKRGTTSKLFKSLTEAYKFLKPDSPDLQPRDIYKKTVVYFADGYSLHKSIR